LPRPYPRARCGKAGGGDYAEFDACTAFVRPKQHLWFGGDPIETITLASVPLGSVSVERPFTGEVFTLTDGEFVTYPAGAVETGDKIVCDMGRAQIDVIVPRPDVGVSQDPVWVSHSRNGTVRAECGGIHAETAPPGSW